MCSTLKQLITHDVLNVEAIKESPPPPPPPVPWRTLCAQELGAHAITLNAYMGVDTVKPFLTDPARGVFVLCKVRWEGGRSCLKRDVTTGFSGERGNQNQRGRVRVRKDKEGFVILSSAWVLLTTLPVILVLYTKRVFCGIYTLILPGYLTGCVLEYDGVPERVCLVGYMLWGYLGTFPGTYSSMTGYPSTSTREGVFSRV